ncbi:outer dense fiber protein 3-like protein 2b isoform X1 [Paramormyrops kingsleyae]|uniref:outer dense fiber protein 3-like protein 2b isoform X1 n=1 Tax=Paramormyrops kingsleyae TaxID=1676925 RepID=UPI003B96BE07
MFAFYRDWNLNVCVQYIYVKFHFKFGFIFDNQGYLVDKFFVLMYFHNHILIRSSCSAVRIPTNPNGPMNTAGKISFLARVFKMRHVTTMPEALKRLILSAGPGPGRYALPPTIGFLGHDFTKSTSPAYSFHGRMFDHMFSVDSSPGPKYHVDAKITRFGRDGTPAYSMLGRMRPCVANFQTPGPGSYNPEVAPIVNGQRRPPSYTMGSRTCYRGLDSIPAPNKYSLPSLMGSKVPTKPASASYTISGHCKSGGASQDLAKTPGPGRYNSTDPSVYLPRQPAFSMLSRHSLPRDRTCKPGPGSHSPEKVMVHKPRPPAFSMGIRHSEFVTPLVIDTLD